MLRQWQEMSIFTYSYHSTAMPHLLFVLSFSLLLSISSVVLAQEETSVEDEQVENNKAIKERGDISLPDSTVQTLIKGKLARLIYESIVQEQSSEAEHKAVEDKRLRQYQEIEALRGKRIANIHILPLKAWGGDFADTAKVEKNKSLQLLNALNPKTKTRTIERSIFVKPGERLDPERILDNERILRALPYIRDARIKVETSPLDTNEVNLIVMTKDVFSYGATGSYSNLKKWTTTVYNKNLFGQGQELQASWIHSANEMRADGYDVQYKMHNFTGTYSNFGMGFTQSYMREGFNASIDRPFLRTDTKWGGSVKYYRYWNSNNFYDSSYDLSNFKMNYAAFDAWVGHAFDLPNRNKLGKNQLVLSARYRKLDFFKRPPPGEDGKQFYSDSKLILGSISWNNRYYIRDQMVREFGTVEDMPKGYFHELVVGYDDNEFLQRWYAHLFFSSGNLVKYRSSYLYLSAGMGTFFNARKMEQGEVRFHLNYISKQLQFANRSMRYFLDINYLTDINRFDQEYITLNGDYGVRGFNSDKVRGKNRLAIKSEAVVFFQRKVIGFNMATFGLLDVGIIGQKRHSFSNPSCYTGLGGGIRMRNDQLIFGTIQLRLVFYPKVPSDQAFYELQFREINPSSPYDFQPRMPQPLEYK